MPGDLPVSDKCFLKNLKVFVDDNSETTAEGSSLEVLHAEEMEKKADQGIYVHDSNQAQLEMPVSDTGDSDVSECSDRSTSASVRLSGIFRIFFREK